MSPGYLVQGFTVLIDYPKFQFIVLRSLTFVLKFLKSLSLVQTTCLNFRKGKA